MSAAMVLPAPGLFSMTMDWPRNSPSGSAMMRETMSVPPPGPKPTMTRMGLVGHSWAATGCMVTASKTAKPAAAQRPTDFVMLPHIVF